MSRDPRADELHNLKLALATFALQLDGFEARLKRLRLKTTVKAVHPAPSDNRLANKIVSAMKSAEPNNRPKSSDDSLP
jgi:hypothetical protein